MKKGYKEIIRKGGSYISAFARNQNRHMRENRDYWNFDNSRLSALPQERKVIIRKKKVKVKRSTRRSYQPQLYYYPPPYYRPRPRQRTVKKVKHKRHSTPREQDEFSMF